MNAAQVATETRRQQAEGRLRVIRNALSMADEELAKVVADRDWEAFGLASFEDYCAEFLPELRFIKLRVDRRQARTKALLEANPDLTEREVAAATGASTATAHRDVLKVTGRSASFEASPPPTKAECTQAAVLALVAASSGVTVHELCAASGWNHGQVSGALSKLHQKKRIERTGVFREGCGVYVATVSK